MSSHAKKLIEVALPLTEINDAAAREKSIKSGHPANLHLWWARRPLAAARAVLFGQLVDDPSAYPDELAQDPKKVKAAEKALGRKMRGDTDLAVKEILVTQERDRLFEIIKQLVIWENTTKESVLEPAREEIRASWRRTCQREGKPLDTPLPPVLDPFAGGGAIPLEAQRLGMEAHASDLNPVAVLINKAMIEIPPRFADQPPVHPTARSEKGTSGWKGAAGLAEDVRRYGDWMREEAFKRVGHLYPPYTLTQELLDTRPDLVSAGYMEGDELTVIAWLWARTVPSPNPALNGKPVPLVSSFWLSKKKGKEAYVEPIVENGDYRFEVRVGKPPAEQREQTDNGTKTGRGANFLCLLSQVPVEGTHVKASGMAGDLDSTLMAVVCEGKKGRVSLPPTKHIENIARDAVPNWKPEQKLNHDPRAIWTPPYGLANYGDLFTDRQLVALNTFCDLVSEAREKVIADAQAAQLPDDSRAFEQEGIGPTAYADSLSILLSFTVNKMADLGNSLVGWEPLAQCPRHLFGRQAIPMIWDFAEANPFSNSSGCWEVLMKGMLRAFQGLEKVSSTAKLGKAYQADACSLGAGSPIVSTDPPYYDNIGYADLSDFFYVWLRRSLRSTPLSILGTLLVPKAEELIASSYRQGGKEPAEDFFLSGMTRFATGLYERAPDEFPVTIYYAFKQSEKSEEGVISTGWATFLQAVILGQFSLVATWPMRTENKSRLIGHGSNALASSIILVCRKREITAQTATRRDFIKALKHELPLALKDLQTGNISPVDLPQSSIGPGIGIFSRYQQVLEADGSPMSVRTALQLINAEVSEILEGQVAEMDDWTRFAVKWFTEYGFKPGAFGDAEVLATAYDVAVSGVAESGILESGQNQVRIFTPAELPTDWNPDTDDRLTVWEVVHHLIRILESEGESAASKILGLWSIQTNGLAGNAKALAYRLFTICEEKKWAELGKSYNGLVIAWPELEKLANDSETPTLTQANLI